MKCPNCGGKRPLWPDEKCPYCDTNVTVVGRDGIPCGILCLTNVSLAQWDAVLREWRSRGAKKDDILVLCGLSPDYEIKAVYTELP